MIITETLEQDFTPEEVAQLDPTEEAEFCHDQFAAPEDEEPFQPEDGAPPTADDLMALRVYESKCQCNDVECGGSHGINNVCGAPAVGERMATTTKGDTQFHPLCKDCYEKFDGTCLPRLSI